MAANSTIEWTDTTWNPSTGCTKISPGCANCYIERTPPFRTKGRRFDDKGHIPIILHRNRLSDPYTWKEPRRVFVNSLSDLFHPDIDFAFVAEVFTSMAQNTRHQFQLLTKRPERLFDFYEWNYQGMAADAAREDWLSSFGHILFGATVENRHFKTRITTLRKTPALLRFLSIEPLLEDIGELDLEGIHWVIVGGESGSGARPFNVQWARSIVSQCFAASVPVFVKQLGASPVSGCVRNPDDVLVRLTDGKGGDLDEWPEDLRVRQFPRCAPDKPPAMGIV